MAELTALPESFPAGTTVVYRKTFADYPANAGWTMTLHLRGRSSVDKAAAASGADFVVTLAAADTDTELLPGNYRWVERVTKIATGEVYDADSGVVTVTLNIATAAAGATQSYAEKTLAVIEAAMTGELTDNMRQYQIAGRAVSMIEPFDLERLRVRFAQTVAMERNPGGFGEPVHVRFTRIP